MGRYKRRSDSSNSSRVRYVKQRHRRKYQPSRSPSTPTAEKSTTKPPQPKESKGAWENIVLHYLSKLKNYWSSGYSIKQEHPTPGGRNTADTAFRNKNEKVFQPKERKLMEPRPNSYTSKSKDILDKRSRNEDASFEQEDYCLAGKRKALNIVSNALEYGLANGIVSKNGNYFWIKDKLVPQYKQSNIVHCASCQKHLNAQMLPPHSLPHLLVSKNSVSQISPRLPSQMKEKAKSVTVKRSSLKVKKPNSVSKKISRRSNPGFKGTLTCKCSNCQILLNRLRRAR